MLTPVGISGLRRFFTFTWYSKALPFKWHKNLNVLTAEPKCITFVLWLVLSVVQFLTALKGLLDFGLLILFPDPEYQPSHVILALTIVFASGKACGLYNFIVLWNLQETVSCFNKLLQVNAVLAETFKNELHIQNKLNRKSVYRKMNQLPNFVVPWICGNGFVGSLIQIFINSTDHRLGWHLLFPNKSFSFQILFRVIYVAYLFLPVFSLLFLFWFFLPVMFPLNINYWLEFLLDFNTYNNGVGGTVKQIEAYKTLQALMALYNDCLSSFAWPCNITLNIYFHVIVTYFCIKSSSSLETPFLIFFGSWSFGYLLMDYYAYPIGGRLREKSEKLMRKWKVQMNSSLGVRCVKSLRYIYIDVGGVLKMEKMAPLIVMYLASNITLNCLLLH